MSESSDQKLTEAQLARIERNRVKALSLRQAKLVCHPYAAKANKQGLAEATIEKDSTCVIKVQGTKYVDSGGGFLLEQEIVSGKESAGKSSGAGNATEKKPQNEAIAIPVIYEECLECGDSYVDSFLWNNFKHSVCDKCRDQDGKHALITRSEAKAEYLLKDCDFDRREPPLRFIGRKNPHNVRWGEMKLYLHSQVEKRAMEVWGSEEELERQHESRDEKREITKVRKYNKQMKELRMEMRSSLFTKTTYENHVHEFGTDTYNKEDDTYTHSCINCPYTETYEKM